MNVDSDTDIDCDVCVIGSGAGGGTAAGVLAAAGLDVVVLEAGGYYSEEDFDGAEYEGYARMYMYGGGAATHDQSVGLLAGSCLGGGTTVNYTTSFRTPDDVREEWAGHGVPAFATRRVRRQPRRRLRAARREPGAQPRVGTRADAAPRPVRPRVARRLDAAQRARLRPGRELRVLRLRLPARREAVHGEDLAGRCARRRYANPREDAPRRRSWSTRAPPAACEARTADGHRVTVRARAVVAACGAIQTPALLRRSGLRNENIGRHLRLHPAQVVWGVFDEEVRPWEGTMQAIYSDEHRYMDGGYGVKYETAAIHPSLLVTFSPWRGGRDHARIMEALPHSVPVGVLLRDRDGGEVRVGRDGNPVVKYRLSDYDIGHMRKGTEGAAQILEAAGAQRIFSSHSRLVGYEPGRNGDRQQFIRDADACGWDAGHCTYGSFHIMGSARMGGSPATSACNPRGETWDVRDLYVCDGSAFPTASGVNPMISIESIAHMNASALAASLSV